MEQRRYVCIDLKSFYASVECVERGLDPLTVNLVVADVSRTEKTICLAVTPSLKAYGISGRARLFEVIQRLKEVNSERRLRAPGGSFTGVSFDDIELKRDSSLEVGYIAAPPRMASYIEYSTKIYQIYLKYVAPEDIHVYSIDEVFIDLTYYLNSSGRSAREFTSMMIADIMSTTGITAAAGIGTNMYLAKVAMDIEAKRVAQDENGVRIAELDEMSYRRRLWDHRPLTDFWRVGSCYAGKLEEKGIYTMGDIARCSVGNARSYYNEELLYRMFGVNAELLIDHAWGYEPCTIAEIRKYKPESSSISSGQVLQHPYSFESARLIVREMTDLLTLELVEKCLVSDQFVLTIGYDVESLKGYGDYRGELTTDHYGRRLPKSAHGTINLERKTSSTKLIIEAVMKLYDRIVDRNLLVRRINLTACRITDEGEAQKQINNAAQLDLFTDYAALERKQSEEEALLAREKNMQLTVIELKKRYGKNIILKGMNLQKDATARERNAQIGGHRA